MSDLCCDCTISLRGAVWAYKTSSLPFFFIEMPVPSQESERSCICVLGLLILLPVPSQESARSCICVLELLIFPVPSQESERSCICVRVIDFACTKPGE